MSYIEDIIEQLKKAGLQDGQPPNAPPISTRNGEPHKFDPNLHLQKMGDKYENEQKGKTNKEGKEGEVEYTKLGDRVSDYKITVASKMMTRGPTGQLFDTKTIKQAAIQKYGPGKCQSVEKAPPPPKDKSEPVAERKVAYGAYDRDFKPATDDWFEESLIWVRVPVDMKDAKQSVFYSSVCRPGAFHHSSLSAGNQVLGAGEWIVRDGKLLKISANSGHFQPTLAALHQSILALSAVCDEEFTTVMLWNKEKAAWEDVRINEAFKKDPSLNNKYKVHWAAP